MPQIRLFTRFSAKQQLNALTYLFALFECITITPLYADTSFSTVNKSPLALIYGLPEPANYHAKSARRSSFNWHNSVHNLSSEGRTNKPFDSEHLIYDGEVFSSDLSYAYYFNHHNSLTIKLKYTGHAGGSSDNTIEQWHSLFGLPNGNRGERVQNDLLYLYEKNGVTQLRFENHAHGAGDTSITWQRQWQKDSQPNNYKILRIGAELPTGSKNKLTGSGSLDIASDFSLGQRSTSYFSKLSWQAGAGLLWRENSGLLANIRTDLIPYASANIALRATHKSSLRIQLDYHSALYDSGIREIGSDSLQLVIGVNHQTRQHFKFAVYFTEDVKVSTSPDFGIGIQLSYSPSANQRSTKRLLENGNLL